jgi:hypothetical protein
MSMLVLLGAAGVVVTAGASTESAYVHLISPSGGGGSAADDRAAMLCVSSISGPVGRSYASHSKLYDV